MSEYKPGNELRPEVQAECLRRYVHRYTRDIKPAWASGEWKDGKPHPVQFASDAEWLANTRFPVTKQGELSRRNHYCMSNPTWPDNPELRKRAV